MGSQLAKAAHREELAGRVSDRARLVLNHMCWMARDTPSADQPAAEYWEGHIALGYVLLGLEAGPTKAGQNAVRRAVKELVDAGLIERIGQGVGTQRARYKILVGGRWQPAKAVDNSGTEALL